MAIEIETITTYSHSPSHWLTRLARGRTLLYPKLRKMIPVQNSQNNKYPRNISRSYKVPWTRVRQHNIKHSNWNSVAGQKSVAHMIKRSTFQLQLYSSERWLATLQKCNVARHWRLDVYRLLWTPHTLSRTLSWLATINQSCVSRTRVLRVPKVTEKVKPSYGWY